MIVNNSDEMANKDEGYSPYQVQIKICGLTRPDEAAACAALGADALGLVFYTKSLRAVTVEQALKITSVLSATICKVGIFVDEPFETIIGIANHVHLDAIQLHGEEKPNLLKRLAAEGFMTIKALFGSRLPLFRQAAEYPANVFLVECGRGPLPGGNAMSWDYAMLNNMDRTLPVILAGGLSADNVADAIHQGKPDAVDVSTGVESAPGHKDLKKVEQFIRTVRNVRTNNVNRRIFNGTQS